VRETRALAGAVAVVSMAAIAAPAGSSGEVATSSAAHNHKVKLGDDYFAPKKLTVPRKAKITFVWRGRNLHNVKATGAAKFKTAYKKTGKVSKILRKKGLVKLVCEVHPTTMKMRIRVK
jgi:plastocyanin